MWPGALGPGDRAGLAGMGSLVSLPAVPRASSAGARIVTWPTPAPVSRTVPSTAQAGTDASTAACRNAWHWACPETVRPAGRQPPSSPCCAAQTPFPSRGLLSLPPSHRPSLLLSTVLLGRVPSSDLFTVPNLGLCWIDPPFSKGPHSSFPSPPQDGGASLCSPPAPKPSNFHTFPSCPSIQSQPVFLPSPPFPAPTAMEPEAA